MKLISWNCQGAFRKKAEIILAHQPDILVVSECECPDKLIFPASTKQPTDVLWFGGNPHKGLGVFSYGEYKFQLLEQHNPDFKTILPIAITGGPMDFTLFCIWANNPQDRVNQYVGQIWKAIHHYDQLLENGLVILTGDFNSNTIWDKKSREGNHSTVVERLAAKDIHSIYHKHLGEEQGKETQPTFYLYRNQNHPYHLDYCFASAGICEKLLHFEVGSYENWIAHSDHSPLIVNFDL